MSQDNLLQNFIFSIKNDMNSKNIAIFAKISAHIERRFKKNAYLCIVADNPSQT